MEMNRYSNYFYRSSALWIILSYSWMVMPITLGFSLITNVLCEANPVYSFGTVPKLNKF